MLARSRLCLLALLVPWVLTCSDGQGRAEKVDSALVDEKGRPSVGHFESRRHKYNLHDLMDAQFRATHADPYVQEFDPDVYFGVGLSNTTYTIKLYRYPRGLDRWPARKSSTESVKEPGFEFNEVQIMLQPLPDRPEQDAQSVEP